ncbi:F-box protein At5g03970-like [Lycium ferocissimum]|uniref:F-box protein At5g03970-like n=1 Tax=Lycium ferocissimum TaxID=112874 RepID=UPI00281497A2|nr:F-box protein At5g03970-like [Lycium ferocissimum]
MVKGNFDECVSFLHGCRLYIIASSMGFLLCCEQEIYQRHYYVYNPVTRQYFALPEVKTCTNHVEVGIKVQTCAKYVAIGFNCKLDDPINKDVISFTIVRYKVPAESTVTIESFSSQTNAWTEITLALENPLDFQPSFYHPSKWPKSGGAIEGVFYWLDFEPRINLYDSVNMCFWSLDLPDRLDYLHMRSLGVSGGILCFASMCCGLTVWQLKSNIRDRTALWDKKYTNLCVFEAFNTCPETLGLLHRCGLGHRINYNFDRDMVFHPYEPQILIVLNIKEYGKFLMCYDMDNSSAKLVCNFGNRKTYTNIFPYEWQEWPLLL